MSKIFYEEYNPRGDAAAIIELANQICAGYQAEGYNLTLRQLYYQFITRDYFPNREQSYNKLKDIVSKARMGGLMDWDYIVDRTRSFEHNPHWSSPSDIIRQAANGYAIDKWADQSVRVEVWVEKEALAEVIERAADADDVGWFSCRGYTSVSAMWQAAQRILRHMKNGQRVVVLHLGDHDPSGIDMTRDIEERIRHMVTLDWLRTFRSHFDSKPTYGQIEAHMASDLGGEPFTVDRIALNMDQVEQYSPPPNPAKLTDSRAPAYVAEHGYDSWELDALDPSVLNALIAGKIAAHRDDSLFDAKTEQEAEERSQLFDISDNYPAVADFVSDLGDDDE